MMASVAFVLPLSAAAAFAFRGAASTSGRLLLALVAGGVFVGVLSVPWSMLIFGNVHTRSRADGGRRDVRTCDRRDRLARAAIRGTAASGGGGIPAGDRGVGRPAGRRRAGRPRGLCVVERGPGARRMGRVGAVESPCALFLPRSYQWQLAGGVRPDPGVVARGLSAAASATVARLWTYAGRESVVAPITIAALFAGSTVLAAGVSVWRRRGAVRGCLAATAILATPSFMHWAPSQCADIPLAFFMLAAFILWQEEHGVLAGLAAGLAAWTKNEGVAFLVVFVIIVVCAELSRGRRQALRRIGPVAAGAAGVALAVITFKLVLAPPSYFTVGQTFSQTLMRTLDLRRAEFIAHALGRELWTNGASMIGVLPILSGFALVRGISRQAPAASAWGGIAVAAMIVVYFLAYLATPLDVAWQVQTSVQRLVVQLVPLTAWSVLSFAA